MIALLAATVMQAGAPPPDPPLWMVADYNPGPWFAPVKGRNDRPDLDYVLPQVREAATMFDIAIAVCVERAERRVNDARDRRLLKRVRGLLWAQGIRDVRTDSDRCEVPKPPRGVDGVMLRPVPR